MARYRQTSGFNGLVERDGQTSLDNALLTPPFPDVSQVQGKVHNGRQKYNMSLKASYKDVYLLVCLSHTQLCTDVYTNQPAILGNEDLDPETIKTYEVGLSYQF